MTGENFDKAMIARAAAMFERAADSLAEQVGDEYTATGLAVALGAFVETRWGTGAVHELLNNLASEIEPFTRPDGTMQ